MEVKSVPLPGDVLFFNSFDIGTIVSRIAQTKLDPDADGAIRTFGHVAIAISSLLALEAVPSDPEDMRGQTAVLKDTVAIGTWTGSELRGGVRLIPIADVVVPAMRGGKEMIVLRTLDVNEEALSKFTPFNPEVLRMLGSQYSIDLLRDKAGARVPKALIDFFGSKFDWTSAPIDLSTRIGVDREFRKRVEERLLDYSLPDAARTYFCSQAVIKCLKIAELVPNDLATDLTTPSGLYRLLVDRKWLDVSVFYRCAPDVKRYLHMTPSSHSASYTSTLAMTSVAIQQDAGGFGVAVIKSSLEAVARLCDGVMKKLP
jgi:hypothetical protein